MPAQVGIQGSFAGAAKTKLDSGLRRNDEYGTPNFLVDWRAWVFR